MSVPYHAWTHRPKAQGGTDPIEFPEGGGGIKWATASKGLTSISYNAGNYEPKFLKLATSDTAAFELAGASGGVAAWLQLNEPGYYHAWSYITERITSGTWSSVETSLETVYDGPGGATLLSVGSSYADFNLEFSRADQKLEDSDDPNSTLFQFNSFHWNPANGDDLGDVDPLKLAVRIFSDGDQGTVPMTVSLHVVKFPVEPGYTLIDAGSL